MEQNFFPQRPTVTPTIYAYKLLGVDSHKGYLKVGYTDRTARRTTAHKQNQIRNRSD